MRTLDSSLTHWMRSTPDALFVREADTGSNLTYRACWSGVQRLRASFGERPQTILMALPGSIAASLLWLTALTGGHRLVPCPPDAPTEERARLAATVAADILVASAAHAPHDGIRPGARLLHAEDILHIALDEHATTVSPSLLPSLGGSVRLTTSGTTGEPKGVILSAEQIAWAATHIARSHELSPRDRGFTVLPFFHINAPVVSLCATLASGGSLVVAPRFSRSRFWQTLADERITWASIVPTILALLLQGEEIAVPTPTLRFVRTASAPLPAAHLRAFEERFGVPVVETYGLSEAASQILANPVPPGLHKPGSVGLPAGVELRICVPCSGAGPEPLRDVELGVTGEVCVRGPSVITAYEGNASAGSFWYGWFRTGDLGYQDEDGYLYLTGRLREVINRGGEKIAPREIEETLLEHAAVEDVAVVGEPDPIYGQRVVAYVVPSGALLSGDACEDSSRGNLDAAGSMGNTSPGATLADVLRAHCAERFAAYKVPAVIYLVDALPRNRTGKIARHLLTPQFVSERALPAALWAS